MTVDSVNEADSYPYKLSSPGLLGVEGDLTDKVEASLIGSKLKRKRSISKLISVEVVKSTSDRTFDQVITKSL